MKFDFNWLVNLSKLKLRQLYMLVMKIMLQTDRRNDLQTDTRAKGILIPPLPALRMELKNWRTEFVARKCSELDNKWILFTWLHEIHVDLFDNKQQLERKFLFTVRNQNQCWLRHIISTYINRYFNYFKCLVTHKFTILCMGFRQYSVLAITNARSNTICF